MLTAEKARAELKEREAKVSNVNKDEQADVDVLLRLRPKILSAIEKLILVNLSVHSITITNELLFGSNKISDMLKTKTALDLAAFIKQWVETYGYTVSDIMHLDVLGPEHFEMTISW